MAENDDILVLTDGEGSYYAVPRVALEAFRVADAQRDGLEDAIGAGDVQGFNGINTTRSNIKSGGHMTSLGFFDISTAVTVSPTTQGSGLAIKEQGIK